ncbi:MAG: MFS transporter [Acidobacteriota bacterium]
MRGDSLLNQAEHPTRKHYMVLSMAWAGWLFDFYDLLLFSFLLVPIKRDLGLSDAQLSFLLGMSLAATAAGGIFFGWLADRIGRKRVLSITILTYSIGTFMCGMSHALWLLLAFRIVTGLGVGGEWATGQTLVGETFPARMRARFAAVMQTGAPAGVALAALVGGFLEPRFVALWGLDWGWRACFFVSVLPVLLIFVIRFFMPESDVWERMKAVPSAAREKGVRFIQVLKTERRLRRLFLLGLVLAVTDMSAYWFTYAWLPKYLYDQLHFSMSKSGLWMLVTQLGFMFLVGVGTGNFSGYGPIFSELFPTRIRNTAMGSAFNLARGVQFFTPLVITWVAALAMTHGAATGLGAGISIGAFFALFTGIRVWLLPEGKSHDRTTRTIPPL